MDSDSVWYHLRLTGGLVAIMPADSTVGDTLLAVDYDSLVAKVRSVGDSVYSGSWTVYATDGTDTTWADGESLPLTIHVSPQLLALLERMEVPEVYALHQNYPNPFNPNTTINYDLPKDARVTLVVYDIIGREVTRLVDGPVSAGYHSLVWNGKDYLGRDVPAGICIARLVTPEYTKSIKMVLLK